MKTGLTVTSGIIIISGLGISGCLKKIEFKSVEIPTSIIPPMGKLHCLESYLFSHLPKVASGGRRSEISPALDMRGSR